MFGTFASVFSSDIDRTTHTAMQVSIERSVGLASIRRARWLIAAFMSRPFPRSTPPGYVAP